ncbi:MAG: glycosyltransferase family 4 protein [Elusimicrobiota bacterium]|jgi:glycosyltransferase involved in cell wall biosynthesis
MTLSELPEGCPIGLVRRASSLGGIEGQVHRWAIHLRDRLHCRPLLLTGRDGPLARKFTETGLGVHVIPELMFRRPWPAAARILELTRREGIRLLQSNAFRESIVCRLVRRSSPGVRHIFRMHTSLDWSDRPASVLWAYHQLDRLTQTHVDAYAVNGEYLRDELIQRSRISPTKIACIYDGRPPLAEPDIVRADGEPLPPILAVVSRITVRKGFETLLRALALIRRRGPPLSVVVYGSHESATDGGGGLYFDALCRMAVAEGVRDWIHFKGHIEDVAAALKTADVVALPSESEGIPNSILEALCLKKLVVATAVGGVPEIIQDETNGFLIPPNDPSVLADRLLRIFAAPSASLAALREAGYRTWSEKFSMARYVEKMGALYCETLAGRCLESGHPSILSMPSNSHAPGA